MLDDRNALEVYRKDAKQRLDCPPLHGDEDGDEDGCYSQRQVRVDGLRGEDASLCQCNSQNRERRSKRQCPEVVHLGVRVGAVWQNGHQRYQKEALWYVEPEDPSPANPFDDVSSVERAHN